MEHFYLLTYLVTAALCGAEAFSMFGWVWGGSKDESTALVADGVPLIAIPYDSMTEDEKFLQEAAKFTEIQVSSPLETCQHKVVMKIRTTCSQMSEEDLAKLSVNLLNCQSAVEGRKMFPCTEEMSLKQCTTDMDADMWNAYHLMSNRARAVCYSARGMQFRALTEVTVNKLMATAHTQIKKLGSLKESQDRLEEQQQHLRDAQTSAHNLVTSNLRELINERALIRTGHTQLASMAEDIRKKLEEASLNHREILDDLTNIQEQAQLIWDKIEASTDRIFAQHEVALVQYEHTLEKLGRISENIQFLWNLTNNMRAEVDQKLNWITEYIGDTEEQIHKIYCVGLHVVYLLCAMVIAAFLNASLLTRVTIMSIVPLNLVSYLKHGMDACLDFASMTVLIILITIMHFLMVGVQRMFGPKTRNARPEPVEVINQNGYANGNPQTYVSSSYTSKQSPQTPSMYRKLKTGIWEVRNAISHQLKRCIQSCSSLIQSVVPWSQQTVEQREELSCSYTSSKKSREDLVYNYQREFPSMSDDVTDFEYSQVKERDESMDDFENILDANELRRRLRGVESSYARSTRSYRASSNRSVDSNISTSSIALKSPCRGITRNGTRCRFQARTGSQYCVKHLSPSVASSVMGD
ncbi:protein brambleberry-like [Hylaeus volcanicus]|uniref:protein brambleberry-like n=1 Tax=Hylaeus volcanicus TaxID=313075 RepID=UPI0023B8092A|nr:protein brambleberry-like [Hylaeus volcanicus]